MADTAMRESAGSDHSRISEVESIRMQHHIEASTPVMAKRQSSDDDDTDGSSTDIEEDEMESPKLHSVIMANPTSEHTTPLDEEALDKKHQSLSHAAEPAATTLNRTTDELNFMFELDAGVGQQMGTVEDEIKPSWGAETHKEVEARTAEEDDEDESEDDDDTSEEEEDDDEENDADEEDDDEEEEEKGEEEEEEEEEEEAPATPTTASLRLNTTLSPVASPISMTHTVSSIPDTFDATSISPVSPDAPQTPTNPVSPITEQEAHLVRDSMASIALSESSLDYDHLSAQQVHDVLATPRVSSMRHLRKPSSLDILANQWQAPTRQSTLFDTTKDEPLGNTIEGSAWETQSLTESVQSVQSIQSTDFNPADEAASLRTNSTTSAIFTLGTQSRSSSLLTPRRASGSSSDDNEVDWSQLDKNEEQEKEDRDLPKGVEDESTAFLLARLEQENAKFSTDLKSSLHKTNLRERSASRPPSMGHLKKLVLDRNAPSFRYSLAPDTVIPEEPPPMTELEFWSALVQDYLSTAVRLPTLTTTKIRAGIPPPLRGVVWASISGARDKTLENAFDRLLGEKSPYEGIINKDVGRSFPGVELFRDAEGEGQKMLGRVLKCFSLQDKDIGYCQGLGFLVGPLLMNMGEKEAFCVLVRLMDHYALRPSFLPSLSGLHMRIYQFSNLLKQHHPQLSEHFATLGVEPAYISQWFLSCFAVTCPLPMLFRIYDVIFAEGANETVMRVALALIRRNEEKMLASSEFEEVMQLLLGRAIWDSYGCNADDLVDDFTSLGNIITHARLAELEKEFENQSTEAVGVSAGFLPEVQAAASRFLGRLWAPTYSHGASKSTSTLSPHTAEKDAVTGSSYHSRKPSFLLRRSPSKQSISTVNEHEGSSNGSNGSIASTAPTEVGTFDGVRDSTTDMISLRSKSESMRTASQSHTPFQKEQQDLNSQIEDLLMTTSEMQREHAELTAMLQKEREERGEDHRAVKQLIGQLNPQTTDDVADELQDRRRTMPSPPRPKSAKDRPVSLQGALAQGRSGKEDLNVLVRKVEERLESNTRFSASFETKAQLRSTLIKTREQLSAAQEHSRELVQRLDVAETSLPAFQSECEDLRAEVSELRSRVNEEFKSRQKLEFTIQEMRAEARNFGRRERFSRMSVMGDNTMAMKTDPNSRVSTGSVSSAPPNMTAGASGLRELKLGSDGRRDSSSSVQSMRIRSRMSERRASRPTLRHSSTMPLTLLALDVATSPNVTDDEQAPETPFSPASVTLSTTVSASNLAVPDSGFAARTSSLATQEVFATTEHESVPEEALLLELVNAKTAEAQAKQEVDEMRRALNIQKRRHEEQMQRMQIESDAARAETHRSAETAHRAAEDAERARYEMERTKLELERARLEAKESLLMSPSLSLPGTPGFPAPDYGFGRPVMLPEPVPLDVTKLSSSQSGSAPSPPAVRAGTTPTPPGANTVGGWFWSRRTASTAKAVLDDRKEGTW